MVIRELFTVLGFKYDQKALSFYNTAIKESIRLGKNQTKEFSTAAETITKFGNTVSNVGRKMTYALSVPTALFTGWSIQTASAATEIENRFNQVFQGINKEAEDFVDNFSIKVGRSIIESKASISRFQALFSGFGAGTKDAFELSKQLQQLTTDLVSFYDIPDEVAALKAMSGVSGEIRPLRQLGIDVSIEAIERFAKSKGISDSIDSMSQLQKAMLRVQMIQESMEKQKAVGDAARTVDQFANAVRNFMGGFRDFRAEIGKIFIETLKLNILFRKGADAFKKLAIAIRKAPRWIKVIIVALTGLVIIIPPLIVMVGFLITAVGKLGLAMIFLSGATSLSSMSLKAFATISSALLLKMSPLLLLAAKVAVFAAVFYVAYKSLKRTRQLIYDDLATWKEGGESLIGLFFERGIENVKKMGGHLKEMLMGVFTLDLDRVTENFNAIEQIIKGSLDRIANMLTRIVMDFPILGQIAELFYFMGGKYSDIRNLLPKEKTVKFNESGRDLMRNAVNKEEISRLKAQKGGVYLNPSARNMISGNNKPNIYIDSKVQIDATSGSDSGMTYQSLEEKLKKAISKSWANVLREGSHRIVPKEGG